MKASNDPAICEAQVTPAVSTTETSVLRREIVPTIEPVAGPAAIIDFTSSDQTLDRYQEVIVANGWRLENYRKNPVVQNAHQYGDILFTIGKATMTEVRGDRLYQRVEFATDVNPMARIAYGLYKGRFLNAVSVGFLPMRWEDGTEKSGVSRRFLEQELLEVSAVGIPANPNALQLGLRDGAIKKSDLKEALELLCAATGGRSEVGGQKSEVKSQRSEIGSQRSEVGDQRSAEEKRRSVATNMVEEEILRAIRSVLGHEIFRGYCKQK